MGKSNYAELAGANGQQILRRLFPNSSLNPTEGLMASLCPETADAVHDFLRLGLLSPVDASHFQGGDSFTMSTDSNVLQNSNARNIGTLITNWQGPVTLQIINKPATSNTLTFAQYNQMVAFHESIREILSSDVDNAIEQVKQYISLRFFTENSIPTRFGFLAREGADLTSPFGHVVVHGVRSTGNVRTVYQNANAQHPQHFFVFMLYDNELYLVDAMGGYAFTHNHTLNADGTPLSFSFQSARRGPTVTKDKEIIRAYLRDHRFRFLRYSSIFDSVKSTNVDSRWTATGRRRNRHRTYSLSVTGELDSGIANHAEAPDPF